MNATIKNTTIFVTGGAGFIGSYLVEELVHLQPKKIIILDNLIRGSLENIKEYINQPVIEFIEGDLRDFELVDKLMSQTDYLFHMAGLRINACAANPEDGFDVMIKATFNIMQSAVKHKIQKVIFSSSASVYGLAQQFPTPETDNPYNNQTFYGGAKLFGEQLLRSYYYMYGLNYVALRYFNVYGPRMDTDGKYTEVMIKWLDCIKNNQPPKIFGNGATSMDFVYVQDVARANIAALLSHVTDETFNIGCQIETSLKELLELILQVNHSKLAPVFMPENMINPVKRRLADISKVKRMLRFEPMVSLENGIKKLSEWYYHKQKK